MNFNETIEQKLNILAKTWSDKIAETYAQDTANFLKRENDPFSNPVGQTNAQAMETILKYLIGKVDYKELNSHLDPVIRIRAIQDFRPSKAVAFIFFIKPIIRDLFKKENQDKNLMKEILKFETKVDDLSLHCFNIYMSCREKIYDLRANEMKDRAFNVLKRANLIKDVDDDTEVEK